MSVFANKRSITHKGDKHVNVCAPPDVCKTPSPGGPVPIPYINIAKTSDLSKGAKKVKIEGNPIAHASSNLMTSYGDEPGTVGGIISNKFKGKMTWKSYSLDVKAEGKGVVRFMDATMHNNNLGNSAFMEIGSPNYGTDFEGACDVCGKPPEEHPEVADEEDRPTAKLLAALLEALQDDYDRDVSVELEDLKVARAEALDVRKKARALKSAFKKQHGHVTPEHIAADNAASAKVKELNARITEAESARKQSVEKPTGGGYMIGVMMCTSHADKVFVTTSGKNPNGFNRVAGKMSEGKNWDVIEKASVGPPNFVSKNSKIADSIERRWSDQMELAEEHNFPRPGVCAAQILLSEGDHQAEALTEAWFAPLKQSMSVNVVKGTHEYLTKFMEALRRVDPNAVPSSPKGPFEFHSGDFVPSCETCQAFVPFLLCEKQSTC